MIGLGVSPFLGSVKTSFDAATISYMNALGIANDSAIYFDGAQERTGHQLWLYVNQMVSSLKGGNIWNKCYAIYPFLGATADRNKYNLKSPLNADESYRLTYVGTIVHDKLGITVGPTSDYANTNLIGIAAGLSNSTGLGFTFYSGTSFSNTGYMMGDHPNFFYYSDTDRYIGLGNGFTIHTGNVNVNSINTMNRAPSGATERHIRNGTLVDEITKAFVNAGDEVFLIGAIEDATIFNPTQAYNLGFTAIHEGLTTSEETDMYNLVNTWKTNLSR